MRTIYTMIFNIYHPPKRTLALIDKVQYVVPGV
jgi:hypothetical protein